MGHLAPAVAQRRADPAGWRLLETAGTEHQMGAVAPIRALRLPFDCKGRNMRGFHDDIEHLTTGNSDYRRVLYTGKNLQLVLMSLPPGCEIGAEIHDDRDQFFRFEEGSGEVDIDENSYQVSDGSGGLRSGILGAPGAGHAGTGQCQRKGQRDAGGADCGG